MAFHSVGLIFILLGKIVRENQG